MEAFSQKYKMNYISKANDDNNVSIVVNISGNHNINFQKIEHLTKQMRSCLDNELSDYQNEEIYTKEKEAERINDQQKRLQEKQKLKLQKEQERQNKKKQLEQIKAQKEKLKMQKKYE